MRFEEPLLGLLLVGGSLVVIVLLVLVSRVIDRARGIDPRDRWSGYYRGKSSGAGAPRLGNGPEFDSMNDHGNRDVDGGL
jgi:hypothetical protein